MLQNNLLYYHDLMYNECASEFFSGDTDAVVPVTATRYSISALKLPTLMNWYPCYDNGKVGLLKGLFTKLRKFWPRKNRFQYDMNN